ncbi:hypothetical protein ACJMK2_013432, partial [Sinanodonta woodiana]
MAGDVRARHYLEFIVTTESPLTTTSSPLCVSGSMKEEDCGIFFCQDGQWQVGEFTATQECCLQTFHPKCQAMGFTSTGQATDVSSTEFIVTTESPLTTTSSPLCVSGSMKEEDCGIFFCQDGQWQVGEFTATQECCLQTFHPECQAMGITSTGQATDVSSTEFIPTTQSPPTTTSTHTCDSGSMKAEDCRMFFCQDGQWQVGELIASKECCIQNFLPKCQAMGFTSTGQATELTSTGQATGLTSTEFIPTTQSTPKTTSTPTCDSGSMKAEDCRMFFCQDGQWQVGEFTATKECCLQTFHPKCQVMGFTTTVTTESTPTTTPVCESGSMIPGDCQFSYCLNGEWQISEFTATKECCLKSFHPRCIVMGFTPTGQATGLTTTEFIPTTQSPPTTSTPTCDSGSMKAEDCRMFFCEDGQWQPGELIASKECCIQNFLPKCEVMGFTTTVTTESTPTTTPVCESGSMIQGDCQFSYCMNGEWRLSEFTATKECCLKSFHPMCIVMGFTPTGQATGLTTTEFIPTTQSSHTTSTPTCDSGSMKAEDCRMFFCEDGQWQVGELIASKECCIQNFLPKCKAMGFTTTVTTESPPTTTVCESGSMIQGDCDFSYCQNGQWLRSEFIASEECCLHNFHPRCEEMGFTPTGQATDLTSTEFTSTTIATTTMIHTCEVGSGRIQDCTVYLCENGEWQPFEFLASEECCLKVSHPMCEPTGFTSPVSSSTTGSPNADCSLGSSRVEECGIYICENGQWQRFEFFASEECCLIENHPKCEQMGFSSPVSSSTTGSPNAECAPGSSSVHECGIYICENGQWQLFEFFVSEECCLKENHPKCAALTTPPKDDSSSHEWPLTDCDSDSPEEELDVILIRLPLLPDLPFPVAYRNDRPLKAHKDTSGDEHA